MATIKDIAKKLGVSVSTVSYALNGGPRSVPEHVRDRVLEAARELDYRPNRVARSLVTRRTHAVGLVPTNATENLALSPFFQNVFNGIVNEAERLEQDVVVFTRYSQTESEALIDTALDGRVDGLLFVAPPMESVVLPSLIERGFPSVVVSAEHWPEATRVVCDNRGGVTQAVRHLIGQGHKRIGMISGGAVMDDARIRSEAFRDAVCDAGLDFRPDWVMEADFTTDRGYEVAFALLQREDRPTALFCANDEMAIGTLRAAWELDIRVPDRLSIVGFDDAPTSRLTLPGLTTVRQPFQEMGAAAVQALVDLVEGRTPPRRQQFLTELIVRASTTCPPEDNLSHEQAL